MKIRRSNDDSLFYYDKIIKNDLIYTRVYFISFFENINGKLNSDFTLSLLRNSYAGSFLDLFARNTTNHMINNDGWTVHELLIHDHDVKDLHSLYFDKLFIDQNTGKPVERATTSNSYVVKFNKGDYQRAMYYIFEQGIL